MQIDVLERATPAAHCALVGTVLIDTGDGAGVERVWEWLAGRPVELIALTHAHMDHAGGVSVLAARLGVPVALHADDVPVIQHEAAYLHQWLDDFAVDRPLSDGERLPGGIEVIATASQTPGHVAYWLPDERVVFSGDLVQADDVAWMPLVDGALDKAIEAVRRISALRPARVISGHGPAVTDVDSVVERTIARYESWKTDPQRRASHAARRVAAAWVAGRRPRPTVQEAVDTIATIPFFTDLGASVDLTAAQLARATVDQLVGSGALAVDDGHLQPRFAHE